MKKLLCVVSLVAIIGVNTVFADYPSGLGIGIQGGTGSAWRGGDPTAGAALSLKVPGIPIFWAIDLDFNPFGIGISGDYYIIHNALVSNIGLDWYLGVGVGVNLSGFDNELGLGIVGRIPIGLSWQPIDLLEIYLQVVPSLGFSILPKLDDRGGWGGAIGIRIWL